MMTGQPFTIHNSNVDANRNNVARRSAAGRDLQRRRAERDHRREQGRAQRRLRSGLAADRPARRLPDAADAGAIDRLLLRGVQPHERAELRQSDRRPALGQLPDRRHRWPAAGSRGSSRSARGSGSRGWPRSACENGERARDPVGQVGRVGWVGESGRDPRDPSGPAVLGRGHRTSGEDIGHGDVVFHPDHGGAAGAAGGATAASVAGSVISVSGLRDLQGSGAADSHDRAQGQRPVHGLPLARRREQLPGGVVAGEHDLRRGAIAPQLRARCAAGRSRRAAQEPAARQPAGGRSRREPLARWRQTLALAERP